VVITGNATLDGFQLYRIEYGPGLNPTEWRQLGGDYGSTVEGGPLAFWDTNAEEEGLYTLQLTVVRGDQSLERRALQVTVDNTPPEVELINPEPNTVYERDPEPLLNDWINFQVDARDNFSISRVEYFMDNEKIGESTVAPHTLRWNVVLTETEIGWEPPVMTQTQAISGISEAITATQEITVTHVVTVTEPITDPQELAALPPGQAPEKLIGYQKVYSGGLTQINTTYGYTETHLIHVVAIDSAGNETKSDPLPVRIIPRKDEDEDSDAGDSEAYFGPAVPGPRDLAGRRESM
jgi:hypothetical protein